ncbi:MAG: bifunctional phosphoglucose/phosphomannose isomerase [Bacteroidetes bacterium]|nr:bifunctional phosphoglucose/phosphomannose isomerase [Bacteroidota bacterium]
MTKDVLKQYDKSNMFNLLAGFPLQIEDAVSVGKKAKVKLKKSVIKNIVVSGLGGSAIGGDLIRTYLAAEIKIPFLVNRHYFLPEFVNGNSLVIISSYSGDTEETISAHKEAIKRGAQVLCITSGGETERLAKKNNQSLIKIPTGYPPRAALGYAFFPLLVILGNLGLIKDRSKDIEETIAFLKKKSKRYSDLNSQTNEALSFAKTLSGKLPIVYSSADVFDSVNLRWRGQLCENSKILAFGHTLPEMNHNELVGWKVLIEQMADMMVIFLRDKGDYKRVQLRMKIMEGIVKEYASNVVNIYSEGNSLLTRMFSLIFLGDWISYYLAILNKVDPTPVKVIDYLKAELAKI